MSLQYSTTLFIYQPGLFPKSTVNSVTTLTRAGALTFEDRSWLAVLLIYFLSTKGGQFGFSDTDVDTGQVTSGQGFVAR